MMWDKDNPPGEYFGVDVQVGRFFGLLAVSNRILHWAVLAIGASLCGLFMMLILFAAPWQALSFLIIPFGVLWVHGRFSPTTTFLYYQFFDDTFRVSVDIAGPITFWTILRRRPMTGTIRFTQDDIKMLSVSQRPEYFPHDRKSGPAIRLTFTLLDEESYHQSQLLDAENNREHVSNLHDFQHLLDRLESALGPDRIETEASLKDARIALQRALQVNGAA